MESKKSIGKRVEEILVGRGFYIVMVLCAAIIGVSIWSLFKTQPKISPDESEFDEVLSEVAPVEYDLQEPTTDEAEESFTEEEETAQETVSEQSAVWPVDGEVQRDYSMDALQYDPTMSDWRTHDGVDIKAEEGDAVKTAADGTVKMVRYDDLMGVTVVIAHADGYETQYSSLQQEPPVEQGKTVKAGDIIGRVGSTAAAEGDVGPHLHFSVSKDGKVVNPSEYVKQ